MHIVIRIAVETDDGRAVKETEVIRLDRGTASTLAEGGLGLTMPQAKAALAAMQKELVAAGRRNSDAGVGVPGLR